MKRLLLAALFLCPLAIADGKDWEKPIFVDECGQSEGDAKAKVRVAAQNEENFYSSVCDASKGKFSASWGKGRCDKEPQNITCPVVCTLSGKAHCNF